MENRQQKRTDNVIYVYYSVLLFILKHRNTDIYTDYILTHLHSNVKPWLALFRCRLVFAVLVWL